MIAKGESAIFGNPAEKISSAKGIDKISNSRSTDMWKTVESPHTEPELRGTRFGFGLPSFHRAQGAQKPRSPLAMRRPPSDGRPGVAKLLRLGRSETVSHRQPKLSPLKGLQRDFKQRTRPNTRVHHPVSVHGVHQILDSLQRMEPEKRISPKITASANLAGATKEEILTACSSNMDGNTPGSTQGLPPVLASDTNAATLTNQDAGQAIPGLGNTRTLCQESEHTRVGSSAVSGKATILKVEANNENRRPRFSHEALRGGNINRKTMHPTNAQIESPPDPFTDIPIMGRSNTKSGICTTQLDKSAGGSITPLRKITPPEQQLHLIARTPRHRQISSVGETPFSQSSTPELPIFPVSGGDAGNPGRSQFYAPPNKYTPSNTNLVDRLSQPSGVKDGGVGQEILHELEALTQRYPLTGVEPTAQGISVEARPRINNTETGHNFQPRPNRRLFFTPTLADQPEDGAAPATVPRLNTPGPHPHVCARGQSRGGSGSESGVGEGSDISNKFSHLRIQSPRKAPPQ